MKPKILFVAALGGSATLGAMTATAAPPLQGVDADNARAAQSMLEEGRKTFRY